MKYKTKANAWLAFWLSIAFMLLSIAYASAQQIIPVPPTPGLLPPSTCTYGLTGLNVCPIGQVTPALGTFTGLTATGSLDSGQITSIVSAAPNTLTVRTNTSGDPAVNLLAAGSNSYTIKANRSGNTLDLIAAAGNWGQVNGANASVSLGGFAGAESLRVVPVASAVNRLVSTGATAGNTPTLAVDGSDAAANIAVVAKGAAIILQSAPGVTQAQVTHTASAANYLKLTGGVASSYASLGVGGTDTNSGILYQTKGSGAHVFATIGGTQFVVNDTTSATNNITVTGSAASNPVISTSAGNLALSSTGGQITTTTQGMIYNVRTITAAGNITVAANDNIVCIAKTVGAASAVSLPASPATGWEIVIKDCKGDAAANNITITPAAGNIDGAVTAVINVNYGMRTLFYNGTQWFIKNAA